VVLVFIVPLPCAACAWCGVMRAKSTCPEFAFLWLGGDSSDNVSPKARAAIRIAKRACGFALKSAGSLELWWQAVRLAGSPVSVFVPFPFRSEPSQLVTARVIRLEVARVRPVSSSEISVRGGLAKRTAQLDNEKKRECLHHFSQNFHCRESSQDDLNTIIYAKAVNLFYG
jgi:hypothetical protein